MIIGSRRRESSFAQEAPSSIGDIFSAAYNEALYSSNPSAKVRSEVEAFDDYIKRVEDATGVVLENPAERRLDRENWTVRQDDGSLGVVDPYDQFEQRISELRAQFPKQVETLGSGREPLEDAKRKARTVDRELLQTQARYRGLPGTGTLSELAGSIVGGLNDPLGLTTSLIGLPGRAAVGLTGLLYAGVRSGAYNAAVETSFQPFIRQWRQEAGLGYDVSHFAMNVSAAGVLGFGADIIPRGIARGVRRARGDVPVLDEKGGIAEWRSRADAALDEAGRNSPTPTIRAAAEGDTKALRILANETGIIDNPDFRRGLEAAEDAEVASIHRPDDIDSYEFDEATLQGMRSQVEQTEPVPLPPVPVYRSVPGEIEAPEILAARQRLQDGDVTLLQAATLIRRHPTAVNQEVSLASGKLRQARAIARLSEAAFARTAAGDVHPKIAALVAQHIEDPADHVSVLMAVKQFQPQTESDARRAVHIFGQKNSERNLAVVSGVDDVMGQDGAAQLEALKVRHAEAIDRATSLHRTPGVDENLDVISLTRDIEAVNRLREVAAIIRVCKP